MNCVKHTLCTFNIYTLQSLFFCIRLAIDVVDCITLANTANYFEKLKQLSQSQFSQVFR